MESLGAVGVGDDDQSIVADSLVFADMRGITTHGVSKLPVYVRRIRSGGIDPAARPECLRTRGALACVDGHNGLGQVSATAAMSLAIQLALSHGVGVAVVRNSNHFGAAAYFALMAASRDLIGVAISNANPTMAPWGGADALLGTNPIAIAVPTGGEFPLVLDMACSTVSRGRIIQAARDGEPIPPEWAFDQDGNPTTDATRALAGRMAPLGGPKGSGLAAMVDVLSGVLSGASFLSSVGPLYEDLNRPQGVGHLLAAINVNDIMPLGEFRKRMSDFVDQIRGCRPAREGEPVYLPGEPEILSERRCLTEGVPLGRETLRELDDMAAEIGVAPLSAALRRAQS